MKRITEQHIEYFNCHAILLTGAGISVRSGIPSVYPFTQYLLKRLGATDADTEAFITSGFPFEAMMEVLKTRLNIFKLLSLFDVVNPNNNHHLIALLAHSGWIKLIVTTNFDRNIEIALMNLGLLEAKDFHVILDLEKIIPADLANKLVVLKLHGSIEDHQSILSTITGVANEANQERMVKAFNLLFTTPGLKKMITWGYSFSDHFDIKPALTQITPVGLDIYSVRYQSGVLAERIINNSTDKLFCQFSSATNWHCSLDNVVKEIFKKLGLKRISVKPHAWKRKMDQIIKGEITGKGLRAKHGTLAALFQTAGQTNLALKYAEAGLRKIGKRSPDELLKMDLLGSLGKANLRDPNNRDAATALTYLEQALAIAKKVKNTDYVMTFAADVASCYNMLGRYSEAETPYLDVINYYKKRSKITAVRETSLRHVYGYQIMLAHCYAKQDKFSDAFPLYHETLVGCREKGFLANQELCMAGYGLAHVFNKAPEKALSFFEEGYALAVLNGSIDRIKSQFALTCSWTWVVHGELAAQLFYDSEFNKVKEKTGFTKTLKEIGPGLTGSMK